MTKNLYTGNEKPPFAKKWSTLYWIVIANLVLLLVLFYFFKKAFE